MHFHFFQDVYEWAGKTRQIRTGKGGNWFCYPEFIDAQMEQLFAQLADEDYLTKIDNVALFAKRAAHYIGEVNVIHPFREGNGRCQLTLLTMLAEHSGFELLEDRLNEAGFMEAMIASFYGDNVPLANAITALIF